MSAVLEKLVRDAQAIPAQLGPNSVVLGYVMIAIASRDGKILPLRSVSLPAAPADRELVLEEIAATLHVPIDGDE